MKDKDLDAAIKAIFWRVFQVRPEEITDQTGWDDLERWDSLGHLELVEALREEFQIAIPPEEALEMGTVGDIKRIVGRDP
jgi:acyl carrier protein